MKLRDAVRSARPVFLETDNAATPYAGQGTCFLAIYGSSSYVFTAAHVLRDLDPRRVLIFPNDGSPISIPFSQFARVSAKDDDSDHADVVAFRIDATELVGAEGSTAFFVDLALPHVTLAPGDALVIAGYPDQSRDIDYDAKRMRATGEMVSGYYTGPRSSKHLHTLRLADLGAISDFSGFSGSPVFRVEPHGTRAALSFHGIVIRGGVEAGVAHFIDQAVIRAIAQQ